MIAPFRYPSPSATFIRQAMLLPLPRRWEEESLLNRPPDAVVGMGPVVVLAWQAEQLGKLRMIQAHELCRAAGLDPTDLEDRVLVDGVEVKASEYDKAKPAMAIVSIDERQALVDLLDDVRTFFDSIDRVDREDERWATSPEISRIASMVDMLRGSWRRACEATGRGPK